MQICREQGSIWLEWQRWGYEWLGCWGGRQNEVHGRPNPWHFVALLPAIEEAFSVYKSAQPHMIELSVGSSQNPIICTEGLQMISLADNLQEAMHEYLIILVIHWLCYNLHYIWEFPNTNTEMLHLLSEHSQCILLPQLQHVTFNTLHTE